MTSQTSKTTQSTPYKKAFPISWEQLQRDCKALAVILLRKQKFKGIIAITRGGLVPAAIMARELNIRLIETVCIASYDWQSQGNEISILKKFESTGENWLVIDDLVDTGRTARQIRTLFPKAHFATLYAKPAGKHIVDTFITEVSQDTWILFPWDSEIQYCKPLVNEYDSL